MEQRVKIDNEKTIKCDCGRSMPHLSFDLEEPYPAFEWFYESPKHVKCSSSRLNEAATEGNGKQVSGF